jgi:asparagine synthetase B (glutamine-hydrolysing)
MGALLVVSSPEPPELRAERLRAMAQRSPHRGTLQQAPQVLPGLTLGIQARHDEASFSTRTDPLVAIDGRVYPSTGDDPTSGALSADTLAELWQAHGQAALSRLDGQYALCVVDPTAESAFVCVSLMMTRALHVASGCDALVIASEIRQCLAGARLERRLDAEQVALCFWFSGPVLQREKTEYQGIERLLSPMVYRVRPGCPNLTTVGRYWTPPAILAPRSLDSDPPIAERLVMSLGRAVSTLTGKVGQSLSAGHDSGLLWAIARRTPPRCGAPSKYSLTWPGDPDDERPHLQAMLADAGETATFIDAPSADPSELFEEHINTLDRIPIAQNLRFATLLARHMAQDGVTQHLIGAGAEAALMVESTYLADLLRAGRFLRFFQDILRFHPYSKHSYSSPARLRYLLASALAPRGSSLRSWLQRLRRHELPSGVGAPWQPLCQDAARQLDRSLAQGGYGRGRRLFQIEHDTLLTGIESVNQVFEHYGIENIAPYTYRTVIDTGIQTPAERLCRGRFGKQAHRDAAAFALGKNPAWPTSKLIASALSIAAPCLHEALGPLPRWRLTELGVIDIDVAREMHRRIGHLQPVALQWNRAPYFERYLREIPT